MGIGYECVSAYSAALDQQRRLYAETQRDTFAAQLRIGGLAAKRKAQLAKCPSCGSREFREHNMVRICSYCRSEA